MSTCVRRIAPTFGRFVVFSSTDFSFHGHPAPMPLPPNRMRRSLAFYYYTEGDRPVAECEAGDCASFHDARWQDPIGCASCRGCAREPTTIATRRVVTQIADWPDTALPSPLARVGA